MFFVTLNVTVFTNSPYVAPWAEYAVIALPVVTDLLTAVTNSALVLVGKSEIFDFVCPCPVLDLPPKRVLRSVPPCFNVVPAMVPPVILPPDTILSTPTGPREVLPETDKATAFSCAIQLRYLYIFI